MGDMKTPDFDDLLAAFDIPDIHAIQSSPEQKQDEVAPNVNERASSSFPCSPASHVDPPVVSVIVKNTVRSESCEEEERSVREDTKADSSSNSRLGLQSQVKLGDVTSPYSTNPSAPAIDPQIANGFQGSAASDQKQSNIAVWPQHSPLRSILNDDVVGCDKGAEVGSVQHKTDAMNSLKHNPQPESSTSSSLNLSATHFPYSGSPRLPSHSHQKNETLSLCNTPSSPLPHNGSIKGRGKSVMHSDDDDSEPDLGSPLVIHESPEFAMPLLKRRIKRQPEPCGFPESYVSGPPKISTLASVNPELRNEQDKRPTIPSLLSTAQPQSPLALLPSVTMGSASVQEEKYPEHVIDERDSPESPPPSETGLLFPKRSSSPDLAQTQELSVNQKVFDHQEMLMGSEPSQDKQGNTEEQSEKMAVDGQNVNEEKGGQFSQDTVSARAGKTVSSESNPLKVKIKMPAGRFTRTVTGVAPKRTLRATSRGDGSKPSPECHNTRSKSEVMQQSQPPTMAILQDACAATLDVASTVKDKTTVAIKPKVSPTAVSITKAAALPSISLSSAKVSPGRINMRSLGQKAGNSGTTLPAPSALLPSQSSSRPASIVNSTGAIISKSQTNLVETFNKILNNKNLLPIYKPDLSSPPPAEWGLPLPAQVSCCSQCGDNAK